MIIPSGYLVLLRLARTLVSLLLRSVGLPDFHHCPPDPTLPDHKPETMSLSTVLIRELLPVTKFSGSDQTDPPENCAVCLYKFSGGDDIRRLPNCCHKFHRSCLDRWMDHDRRTCPLCRTQLVPEDLLETFNERLWTATGVLDFYGEI